MKQECGYRMDVDFLSQVVEGAEEDPTSPVGFVFPRESLVSRYQKMGLEVRRDGIYVTAIKCKICGESNTKTHPSVARYVQCDRVKHSKYYDEKEEQR